MLIQFLDRILNTAFTSVAMLTSAPGGYSKLLRPLIPCNRNNNLDHFYPLKSTLVLISLRPPLKLNTYILLII